VKHLDLFSGIGGFSLAAQWVWGDEHEIVCFVEQDAFCQKVLRYHWPGVPIVGDVRDVESIKQYATTNVDLLTGGVPCQPASQAGKRRGTKDDRWLWGETFKVVRQVHPRWCIFENVRGLISLERGMVFKSLLSELEAIGYEVWSFTIPACAQNAPHRRDRVWIVAKCRNVADTKREGCFRGCGNGRGNGTRMEKSQQTGNKSRSATTRCGKNDWWTVEPNVGRVAHGIPSRVDRLKSLGNAIVPQVVMPIMQAIKEINANCNRHARAAPVRF